MAVSTGRRFPLPPFQIGLRVLKISLRASAVALCDRDASFKETPWCRPAIHVRDFIGAGRINYPPAGRVISVQHRDIPANRRSLSVRTAPAGTFRLNNVEQAGIPRPRSRVAALDLGHERSGGHLPHSLGPPRCLGQRRMAVFRRGDYADDIWILRIDLRDLFECFERFLPASLTSLDRGN